MQNDCLVGEEPTNSHLMVGGIIVRTIRLTSLAAIAALVTGAPGNAANLIGQTASATFDTLGQGTVTQFNGPQTVGPGVEFTGGWRDVFNQEWVFTLDVTSNGFIVGITDGPNGNIRKSDGSKLVGFSLNGLSGLQPVSLSSYTCTPAASFACGVAGGGPNIVGLGSDTTSAYVDLNGIRSGERYEFVFGAVPEPSAWALMILGFAVMGSAMRRRAGLAGALKTRLTYA